MDLESKPEKNKDLPETTNGSKSLVQKLIPPLSGFLLLAILVIWWNFPVVRALAVGTPTATNRPPTMTPRPSRTPRASATPTILPTQTPIPYPTSIGQLPGPDALDPPINAPALDVVVMNDDTHVTPVPDYSSPEWINSDTIAEQMAIEILEPYHATYGSFETMSATWQMDVPLQPGLYDIYVLDTLLSSGGTLDFTVKLGNRELTPLLGERSVNYRASYSNPPQSNDIWHSIGVYWLDTNDPLSVSTTWGQRDEYTIVAIDLIAVLHQPDINLQLINQLPDGQLRYVIDEQQARIEAKDFWTPLNESLSWGDQYQVLINPEEEAKITYEMIDTLPYGKYEILVWIPQVNGNAQIGYRVFLNGGDFPDTALNETRVIYMGDYIESRWVSLGIWEIPEIYQDTARLSLVMLAPGEQTGEVPADAAAFIKVE